MIRRKLHHILLLILFCAFSCSRGEVDVSGNSNQPGSTTQPLPSQAAPPVAIASETSPRDVVVEFGRRMKNVSTTAPRGIAESAIRQNYSKLVEPRLLNSWMSKPEEAPGRPVSSPWPQRIDVSSTNVSGDAATVKGSIVEASSTGEFGRLPVEIRLVQSNGAWLITSFETKSEEPVPSDDRDAAVDVVREYYRAINARSYDTAYRCWGTSGPPGQSPKEFAAGFADTSRVEVMPGKPSQIGAAAGSRYVDVPVTVIATTKDGRTQRFSGMYTLRRSVVDGATIEQRTWHIYSASLRLAKS